MTVSSALRCADAALLAHALAQRLAAAELALVAVRREVPLHAHEQVGVPEPD